MVLCIYLPGSSAQMTNHERVTTEVLINWLPHFTYFQVTSPCMLKLDEATSHQVHSTAGAEECHVITLFCLLSQTTRVVTYGCISGPFQYYWDEQVMLFYNHSTSSHSYKGDMAPFSLRQGKK